MFCVKGHYTNAAISSERRLSTDSTSHYSGSTIHPVSDADDENTIRSETYFHLIYLVTSISNVKSLLSSSGFT